MPYTALTKRSVGDPTDKDHDDGIVDNLDWLYSQIAPSARANMIANPSFEIDSDSDGDPDGYDITDYTGGSHSLDTTNHAHGSQSLKFTSTVLANGGGYADDEDFMEVLGSETYIWFCMRMASAANISAKLEARWYDNSQSFISATTLFQDTSAPTSFTSTEGSVTAPSTARFVKLRRTGGVPAVGSATGDINFDYVRFLPAPQLVNDSVATDQLDLSIGSDGVNGSWSNGTYWTPSEGFYNVVFDTADCELGINVSSSWYVTVNDIAHLTNWWCDGTNMRVRNNHGSTSTYRYQKRS